MYYLVTVGYETEQLDRAGNPRLEKVKYVVESESAEESILRMAKYCSGETRSSEVLAVAQMPIDCVISPKETPEYYK